MFDPCITHQFPRSAEGDALTKLVHLFGTEREQRQAAVQVAEAHAAAAERVADAKNVEAVVAHRSHFV